MGDDLERVSKDIEDVSMEEVEAEDATALPNKEVMSLLDVNANVDLGLDLAAPVDLAVAANLNVAAPYSRKATFTPGRFTMMLLTTLIIPVGPLFASIVGALPARGCKK